MKARIPTAAISRTLQAVATFGLVAPIVPIETTQSSTIATPSHVAEGGDAFAGVLSGLSEERETSTAINFPIVGMWDKATGKRFLDLVDREAKNIATRREIEELERLSDLRRRSELPRSGDEVLREYRAAPADSKFTALFNQICRIRRQCARGAEFNAGQGQVKSLSRTTIGHDHFLFC